MLLMISKIIAKKCEKPAIHLISDLIFQKIGHFAGQNGCNQHYFKEYYIPRNYIAHWHQVKKICEQHGLKALSLENKRESDQLLKFLEPYKSKTKFSFYIGGMALDAGNKNDFYWITSGNRINYDLQWGKGQPDAWEQPNWGQERCLSVGRDDDNEGKLGYNDVFCNAYRAESFVCQAQRIIDTGKSSDFGSIKGKNININKT